MSEVDEIRNERKRRDLQGRLQQLLQESKRSRERIASLEAETQRLRADLDVRERELGEFRSERQRQETRQKAIPALIAKVREDGRKRFPDFDAVSGAVQVGQEVFEALLRAVNGPELMYATGLGLRVIAQARAQADEQKRIDYYRELHRQHFPQGAS